MSRNRRILKSLDCWIDVYELDTFRGRLRRLFSGDSVPTDEIGSIIVGPKAVGCCLDNDNRITKSLPPSKIFADAAKLRQDGRISRLAVAACVENKAIIRDSANLRLRDALAR